MNANPTIEILEARPEDAPAIAHIHMTARRAAMPCLHRPHSDSETSMWFAGVVADRARAWWVARPGSQIAGYMLLNGEDLDHLYVLPEWQRRGIGLSLLNKAKSLSPRRLALSTFQKNTNARAFYEAWGFRIVGFTDGKNEEREPDVQYVWGDDR